MSLNPFKRSFVVKSESAEKMLEAISLISSPQLKIDSVWSDGKKHYAIVTTSRALTRIDINNMNEVLNGKVK